MKRIVLLEINYESNGLKHEVTTRLIANQGDGWDKLIQMNEADNFLAYVSKVMGKVRDLVVSVYPMNENGYALTPRETFYRVVSDGYGKYRSGVGLDSIGEWESDLSKKSAVKFITEAVTCTIERANAAVFAAALGVKE